MNTHTLTVLKGWTLPLLMAIIFGVMLSLILWWPNPTHNNVTDVVIVAICRDGSRIYRREDGTHYARIGINRIAVSNPEAVCK